MNHFRPCLPQTILLSAVIAIAGCKSMSTVGSFRGAAPSPKAQQLESQVNDFNHTVAEAAFAGAAIGALGGLLLGDNKKSTAKGAVIGAIGGAVFGYYIAGQKKEFANREQALDAIALDLQETNRSLQAMVSTSELMLTEDRRRVDQLLKQITTGDAQLASNNALIAQLKSDCKILGEAISASEKRYKESVNNMETYEQQFGVQGIEQLEALLTNYQAQQNILTSLERSMSQLIEDAESSANI